MNIQDRFILETVKHFFSDSFSEDEEKEQLQAAKTLTKGTISSPYALYLFARLKESLSNIA
jgi:hypothetical protein